MTGNVIANQGAPFGNLYLDNGTQHYAVSDNVVSVHPKSDGGGDRSYWLYVQVYPTKATHNVVGPCYTNDATGYLADQIDRLAAATSATANAEPPTEVRQSTVTA